MSSGRLGRPYRVWYQAKTGTTGLTNIQALVKKPNGANLGPYLLTEESNPAFAGMYYFDLVLSEAQPEGEYLVFVQEPGGSFQAPAKVTMELAPDVPQALIDSAFSLESFSIKGVVINTAVTGKILDNPVLVGTVSLLDKITAKVSYNLVKGEVLPLPILKGIVGCEYD